MKTEINKEPIFYCKNGDLTDYALSCGYIQKKEIGNKIVKLFKEHTTYHITVIETGIKSKWLSFDKLTEARKEYKLN